jgi:NAD(P)-dependent dehydrogenase (short-subunit alcohol dehydrogenase family)
MALADEEWSFPAPQSGPDRADWPVVLVTGASTGIGLALLRQLIRQPYRIVATARRESLDRFAALGIRSSPELLLRPLDLTRYDEHKAVVSEIMARWGRLDALVNNAGISYRAVVEHMTPDDELRQMATNYLGPMNLTRIVLPIMRQARRGHIINVSSVGGMMAMPTMAAYSASKFALEGASEALWYEMRPWGVRVCLIEPGFINSSAFHSVYQTAGSGDLKSPYAAYYRHMGRLIERMMTATVATSDSVAARILQALADPDPPLRLPATVDAGAFYWLRRLLPRGVYHRLLYWSLPGIRDWGRDPVEPRP